VTQTELEQSWVGLENALRKQMALPAEGRCFFSDLFFSQCAHCQGHEAWWESVNPSQEVFE
jgi:hypothetical protein